MLLAALTHFLPLNTLLGRPQRACSLVSTKTLFVDAAEQVANGVGHSVACCVRPGDTG